MKDLKTFQLMITHLNAILNRKQKVNAVFVFAFILINSAFETIGVSAVLPFIQAIMSPEQLLNSKYIRWVTAYIGLTDIKYIVILLGIGMIMVYVIKDVIGILSAYAQIRYNTGLQKELSGLVMRSYMNRPYEFFVNHNSSEIIRGVGGDIDSVNGILKGLMQLLSEGMTILFIGIFLLVTDFTMAMGILIIAFCCVALIVLSMKKIMSKMGEINREAMGELNKISIQIIYGIKEIFVKQKRDIFLEKYENIKETQRKVMLKHDFLKAIPDKLIELVCVCGMIGIVLFRFGMGIEVGDFIANLAVFALAAFRILPSVSRMSGYLNSLVFYRPGLEAAYENVTAAREYMQKIEATTVRDNDDTNLLFKDKIEIQNIGWKYNQGRKFVLEGLSFNILKGQSVGIVGESGAGKSTLADILLGLYRPFDGNICVDGINIFDIPKQWSKLIGYVPQNVYLLDDTIKNNIVFGEENTDDLKVWKALERANLKKHVESLQYGLDTIVGEQGIKFSGGQRQRIAIARALYSDPKILILDEATSALDNETEAAIMESIESLQGTITMIIIAHRLTTIKSCDAIYEIKDGKAIRRVYEEYVKNI